MELIKHRYMTVKMLTINNEVWPFKKSKEKLEAMKLQNCGL